MGKIISIANYKGGVGKTATSINLSSALAHYNKRVLLLDLDPQGNASRALGVDASLLERTALELFTNGKVNKAIIKNTGVDNLHLIANNFSSLSLDHALSDDNDNVYLLKKSLSIIKDNYDYIIIDCPPSLGLVTMSALASSDTVLLPIQCECFALDATIKMLAVISNVQSSYNKDLGIEGFLVTMFDPRNNIHTEIYQDIRGLFKEKLFYTVIPRSISVPESNYKGIPVTSYRPTSAASQAYFALAKEVLD